MNQLLHIHIGTIRMNIHQAMIRCMILLIFSSVLTSDLSAQKASPNKVEGIWSQLSDVSYQKVFDEYMGFKVDMPVFGPKVKALHNKEIEVRGYIIPIEGYQSHKEFIFSAFPYASCFFCGAAGPETIMEVKAVEGIKYTTEAIRIRGTLITNDKDINNLMFKLINVKLVKS